MKAQLRPEQHLVRAQQHLLTALEGPQGCPTERLERLFATVEAALAELDERADPADIARARQLNALIERALLEERGRVVEELEQVQGLLRWTGALTPDKAAGDSVDIAG
jgi:hypothetical protein